MIEQYAQPVDVIEIERIEKFIEAELVDVAHLPSTVGVVDTEEIYDQVAVTPQHIKEWYERRRVFYTKNLTAVGFVLDCKEKEIKLAICRLYGKIYERFLSEARALGREMKPGAVMQIVEVPISYLELAPGSTAILFKVFTKRKLVALEVKDGDGVH